MEELNVGIEQDARQQIADSLNKLLADEHVLYVKTRNYHWNVTGPHFHHLHAFFETQYDQLAVIIDEVAENVRQFGGFAQGTMKEFLESSRLKEEPGNLPDGEGMIENLAHDHDSIIRVLREEIERADEELNAPDAADFLTGLLEQHNKMAWMLRSHLTGNGHSHGGKSHAGGGSKKK